ncbi:response regulator transcription factor [Treponema primitia]|uniref:response regulator transcription factor n=1 Tax=Treponema primitia TaxID=88058 RepID=UPI00025550E5|nr:response regulator transcription factor [Treponema primitia]
MPIRIIIAEDSSEIRNYFNKIIQSEADMEVAALAASGAEAVEKALLIKPDIILMDIQMESRTDGIEAIAKIHGKEPAIKAIVLTIHSRDDLLYQAYAAGAMDYIIKTNDVADVLTSIRAVASNSLMLRPEIANKIMSEARRIQETQDQMKEILRVMMKITNTEFEIIKLAYDGYSYKDIATQRLVEETTIRSEIYWILKKFNKNKMKDVIKSLKEINFFETFNLN